MPAQLYHHCHTKAALGPSAHRPVLRLALAVAPNDFTNLHPGLEPFPPPFKSPDYYSLFFFIFFKKVTNNKLDIFLRPCPPAFNTR